MPADVHRLKSGNGIHTNSNPLGKDWNAVWSDFIIKYPNASQQQILQQLEDMEDVTKIGEYKAVKK